MTTIIATGTSSDHYLAERATITAWVSVASQDRDVSIRQGTDQHHRIRTFAEELRNLGDATWHRAHSLSTYARKTYAEGTSKKIVMEHVTTSRVEVKLSNLSIVGEVLDRLAHWGFETNVEWALTEAFRNECERRARIAAVMEARTIAEDYASALGEHIVTVTRISDTDPSARPFVESRFAAASGAPAEVSIPEITVSASVTGEFESE